MSDLDTDYPVALAACVNALDATAHASAETMGAGEMWARICNAVGGGPTSHLTTPVSEIVARIRNAVADPPTASRFRRDQLALIADIRNALSDAPDLSRLTTTGGQLLILTLASLASLAGFGGGGSPGAWLLATGFWADSGVWDDSANWID